MRKFWPRCTWTGTVCANNTDLVCSNFSLTPGSTYDGSQMERLCEEAATIGLDCTYTGDTHGCLASSTVGCSDFRDEDAQTRCANFASTSGMNCVWSNFACVYGVSSPATECGGLLEKNCKSAEMDGNQTCFYNDTASAACVVSLRNDYSDCSSLTHKEVC